MIVIEHFLKWYKTAAVCERTAAAAALAGAYARDDIAFEDRMAAEAALTLLLDDPSDRVRLAMSEALSMSRRAPPQVVAGLAADQPEVAAPVLIRSPLLTDDDLIDRLTFGEAEIQVLIASRPRISMALSAAIAEIGVLRACITLAGNAGAKIASFSFQRMIERHGHEAGMREVLATHPDLPLDCRHMLLVLVGQALSSAPLVQALMGSSRAELIAQDACIKASISLIEKTDSGELAALVEHLRLRGDLTASFLLRAVAHGKINFLATALIALTGQNTKRVETLLRGARPQALRALLASAGLPPVTYNPVFAALELWRDVQSKRRLTGPQEVAWHMLEALKRTDAGEESDRTAVAALLKSIHLDLLRKNAREQALAIAAA